MKDYRFLLIMGLIHFFAASVCKPFAFKYTFILVGIGLYAASLLTFTQRD